MTGPLFTLQQTSVYVHVCECTEISLHLPFLYCLQPSWPCVCVFNMYMCTAAEGEKFHFHFCSSTWGAVVPGCPLAATRRSSSSVPLLIYTFSPILNPDRLKTWYILSGKWFPALCYFSLNQPVFICRPLPQDVTWWTRGESALCQHVHSDAFLFSAGWKKNTSLYVFVGWSLFWHFTSMDGPGFLLVLILPDE